MGSNCLALQYPWEERRLVHMKDFLMVPCNNPKVKDCTMMIKHLTMQTWPHETRACGQCAKCRSCNESGHSRHLRLSAPGQVLTVPSILAPLRSGQDCETSGYGIIPAEQVPSSTEIRLYGKIMKLIFRDSIVTGNAPGFADRIPRRPYRQAPSPIRDHLRPWKAGRRTF